MSVSEKRILLNQIKGQTCLGITEVQEGFFHIHFDDYVLIVKDPFPTKIIERGEITLSNRSVL